MPDNQPGPNNLPKPKLHSDQFELVIKVLEPVSKPNPKPDRFAQSIELVKAIAWPLFGIIVLTSFWNPLYSTIQQLPNIVSRSENITIAGLTLKVGKGLRQQASTEVKQVLSDLSPESIRNLLTSGESTYWDVEYEISARTKSNELLKFGLLEEIPKAELNDRKDSTKYGYGVRLTPLGKETQAFLFNLISEFAQELEQKE